MPITAGQNALASDFITESERNATPANDAGRVPQLESDGKLDSFFMREGGDLTYGETINGATLPVPVYIDSSNGKVLACDGNDTTKLRFVGFAIENGVLNDSKKVRFSGIVPGFSGLSAGSKYYVQDAVGTIGTTPGTLEALVGIAISATEIFILKGRRAASGTHTFSSTTTQAITLGFRPSKIVINALTTNGDILSHSHGGWTPQGGNDCVHLFIKDTNGTPGSANASDNSNAWNVRHDTSNLINAGVITSVTDSGFTLSNTQTGAAGDVQIHWIAEGDL